MRGTWIVVMLLGAAGGAVAADPAHLVRMSELRAQPAEDAEAVGRLAAGQSIVVLRRKGGWYQVRAGRQSGWLRLTALRFGAFSPAAADPEHAAVMEWVATGRSGVRSGPVIGGIDFHWLEGKAPPPPDREALKRLEAFRASGDEAREFAAAGGLSSQSVPDLPAPERGPPVSLPDGGKF